MKKNKILLIVGILGMACAVAGCGKKVYYDIDPNTVEHNVDVNIKDTPAPGEPSDAPAGPTNAPQDPVVNVTPDPNFTPAPTPDISQIDTTKIVSEYKPNMDKTGLTVIDQKNIGETGNIQYLKGLTAKGAVVEIINGTTFVNGLLMVNKTYTLPSYFVPTNTHANVVGEDFVPLGLTAESWSAWEKLSADAAAAGLNVYISSSYRSYTKQEDVFKNYSEWYGKEAADTFSARAGHSEHQSGLCADLNSVSDEFAETAEGKWIDENCWKYGFCIRFPKGQDEITGYKYESWHIRYVGEELAKILYNDGNWISMEDYFGLESHYID